MISQNLAFVNTALKLSWRRSVTNNLRQHQRMSASTLVISEPLDAHGRTPAATQSTVTAATKLENGNDIHLLVVGSTSPTKIPANVSKVYHVPIDDKLSETVATAVVSVIDDDCTVVMGTASKFGSTVIPRAAALLDVSPVTDILEIEDESTFILVNFFLGVYLFFNRSLITG
jgi:electron transfer flavoprotein alpha subunit